MPHRGRVTMRSAPWQSPRDQQQQTAPRERTMGISKAKIAATKIAALVIGGVMLGSVSGPAVAETYPSRNITAIIPFAAGNANDVTARIVFDQLSKQLGQPIIIESKPGAGGTIGVGQA